MQSKSRVRVARCDLSHLVQLCCQLGLVLLWSLIRFIVLFFVKMFSTLLGYRRWIWSYHYMTCTLKNENVSAMIMRSWGLVHSIKWSRERIWNAFEKARDDLNKTQRFSWKPLVHALNEATKGSKVPWTRHKMDEVSEWN